MHVTGSNCRECIFFFLSLDVNLREDNKTAALRYLIRLTLLVNWLYHRRLRLNLLLAHLESCEVISLSSHANDLISEN